MRHKPLTVLFEPAYVVVKASIAGFYKDVGKKFDTCKHVVCGYKTPINPYCRYHPDDVPSPHSYSYFLEQHNKHKSDGCTNAWCKVEYGQPRKIEDGKVPCQRNYYHLYTDQELASPEVKVEFMAIDLIVAGRYEHSHCIAIYDLLNDKWQSDKWWSTTPKGDLMPSSSSITVAPREIYGIEEVVRKAKEGL